MKKIILFQLLMMLPLASCTLFDEVEELTENDKEWLVWNNDSLYYLFNGLDTVTIDIITNIWQESYSYRWGIPHGGNDYNGETSVVFNFSESERIFFSTSVSGGGNYNVCFSLSVIVDRERFDRYITCLPNDTISDNAQVFNGKRYDECYNIAFDEEAGIKKLVYHKDYGVLKLETTQNDVFEILPIGY
ncbi:hypothetical protein ACE01N_16875 [Saccharicrinis sp. FJH2]|uniref:hypothetical protein n=1 Tax=Saccharicrinis sp. FJH65 TaxID=3344659 RepID=UPI0035F25534